MLRVCLTIDTEVSSRLPGGIGDLRANIAHDIDGHTDRGDFGLKYQLQRLREYRLKAIFFVEALFAEVAGLDALQRITSAIREDGHDVQLHLHTEWLSHFQSSPLPGRTGRSLKDFSLADQEILIAIGHENLRQCGMERIDAFRAGNFGANAATLSALERQGFRFDSSYNQCHLDQECAMKLEPPPLQPVRVGDVVEFPVSVFRDRPGHWRPTQLCACTAQEMQTVLLRAHQENWSSLVIVWHSFELIKRDKTRAAPARPDNIVIRRFEQLLKFLSANRDKFLTGSFADVVVNTPNNAPPVPLRTGLHQTSWRMIEQTVRRMC